MSDAIKHECGIALLRLKKPLSFYQDKYGTALFGILIDNNFSIEQIALVSGFYVLIAISSLFLIKNKLKPQYL